MNTFTPACMHLPMLASTFACIHHRMHPQLNAFKPACIHNCMHSPLHTSTIACIHHCISLHAFNYYSIFEPTEEVEHTIVLDLVSDLVSIALPLLVGIERSDWVQEERVTFETKSTKNQSYNILITVTNLVTLYCIVWPIGNIWFQLKLQNNSCNRELYRKSKFF